MKRIAIAALALFLLALPAVAAVPRTLNIQGVLTDDTGTTLPDADYIVQFHLWNAASGGTDLWTEELTVSQSGGVFNTILGKNTALGPDLFARNLWLGLVIDGGAPASPRIELTAVASALSAATVEPGAAVRSLNGLTDNIVLQAGSNVNISLVDTTLVISATAGGGGDDGDWVITGDDLHHIPGRVYVGSAAPLPKGGGDPTRAAAQRAPDPSTAKLAVVGSNEGFRSILLDNDNLGDGRTAIFARRQRGSTRNDGFGYGVNEANTAITGYNDWGDSYTFGVAGYTYWDYNNVGAVFGARRTGSTWASLAYKDNNGIGWGVYTNASIFAAGGLEALSVKLTGGAASGYILTSDASGNATWQAPSAAGADNDWVIAGSDLTRTSTGAVAIGTSAAHTLGDMTINSTLQVSAPLAPALCLDRTFGSLSRASIYHANGGLNFSWSTDYANLGVNAAFLTPGRLQVNDLGGVARVKVQGGSTSETGSRLDLYGSASATVPVISLDSQTGAGANTIGGIIDLRNGSGSTEVTLTANHNNTGIGRVITPVLEITGGSDLAEQFGLSSLADLTKPGMVVSIDPDAPGRLTLSDKAYDRRVAGVISGAGGVNTGMVMGQTGSLADGDYPVALVGRVYVWADASSGPIEPGDLLTTADRPGHAMKVADHTLATGAILGKAMTGLESGQGLILTLVSLQ